MTGDDQRTDDFDALIEALAELDDDDLMEPCDEQAVALCSAQVPLARLFPTLAHRSYLAMPVRLLPSKMHGPFGKKSWGWLIERTPGELVDHGRIDLAAVGALLVSLRTETVIAEQSATG